MSRTAILRTAPIAHPMSPCRNGRSTRGLTPGSVGDVIRWSPARAAAIRSGALRMAQATLLSRPQVGDAVRGSGERTSGSGRDGPDLLHQGEEVHAHPALGEQPVLDPPDVDELDLDR